MQISDYTPRSVITDITRSAYRVGFNRGLTAHSVVSQSLATFPHLRHSDQTATGAVPPHGHFTRPRSQRGSRFSNRGGLRTISEAAGERNASLDTGLALNATTITQSRPVENFLEQAPILTAENLGGAAHLVVDNIHLLLRERARVVLAIPSNSARRHLDVLERRVEFSTAEQTRTIVR